MTPSKLYTYWRSTAAYRVRIALNLKGVEVEHIPVHLVQDGGQQHSPSYVALNPSHLVPTLVLDDGTPLTQSMAIIDYLDRTIPEPAFLPDDPIERTKILAAAQVIASDIHPINNSRVAGYLKDKFSTSPTEITNWMRHWIIKGFDSLIQLIEHDTPFAFGKTPSVADICLVPQIYNARRWKLDFAPYGRLLEIEKNCLALKAFSDAHPDVQYDAETNIEGKIT